MHKDQHTGNGFFCLVCNQTFPYRSLLQNHIQSVQHKVNDRAKSGVSPEFKLVQKTGHYNNDEFNY